QYKSVSESKADLGTDKSQLLMLSRRHACKFVSGIVSKKLGIGSGAGAHTVLNRDIALNMMIANTDLHRESKASLKGLGRDFNRVLGCGSKVSQGCLKRKEN